MGQHTAHDEHGSHALHCYSCTIMAAYVTSEALFAKSFGFARPHRQDSGRLQQKTFCTRSRRRCPTAAALSASSEVAPAAAGGTAPAAAPPAALPFFPDRRCVEDIRLPPLAACHHYINLTNGIEAVPRLQALGLPYRFLRLPSTRCEQQQFEALINDLDGDLLMRLALGQTCLVYDFGSRNKKRGAPRAVWYGLEFIRYALRRLWFGERGAAYLRGYSVANVFEEHVSGFSNATKKKVRYYGRYIQPGGLPQLHLYGVYAATSKDGDKEYYSALLQCCEGAGSSHSLQHAVQQAAAAAAVAHQQPAQLKQQYESNGSRPALEEQVEEAVAAAVMIVQQFSAEQRHALLHETDIHAAVEQLLGMRLWLGGVSHKQYHDWAERTGYMADGRLPSVEL